MSGVVGRQTVERLLLVLLVLLVSSSASAAASRGPVVPWLDRRPAKVAAHPPIAPACRARDLHARLFLQGATGSLVGGVELTNAASSPCSLLGRPRISLTGPAAARTPWHVRRIARSSGPPDALVDPPGSLRSLRPGKSAVVSLYWSNWCGPGSRPAGGPGTPPAGVEIRPPGGGSLVLPVARAPRCDAPLFWSVLSVAPFAPAARRLPPSSRLPLTVAIVGPRPVLLRPGLHAFRARRGELLRFRVALTNAGSAPFRFARSGCPVYLEDVAPAAPEPYMLDCRAAGTIAAHETVLFAMQIPIPARARLGTHGLTWELAPETYLPPSAAATVRIVR
jgi:hypothetical protein